MEKRETIEMAVLATEEKQLSRDEEKKAVKMISLFKEKCNKRWRKRNKRDSHRVSCREN